MEREQNILSSVYMTDTIEETDQTASGSLTATTSESDSHPLNKNITHPIARGAGVLAAAVIPQVAGYFPNVNEAAINAMNSGGNTMQVESSSNKNPIEQDSGISPTPVPTEIYSPTEVATALPDAVPSTVLYRSHPENDPDLSSKLAADIQGSLEIVNRLGIQSDELNAGPLPMIGTENAYYVAALTLKSDREIDGVSYREGSLVVPVVFNGTEKLFVLNDPDGKDGGYNIGFIPLKPKNKNNPIGEAGWPAVFVKDVDGYDIPVSVLEFTVNAQTGVAEQVVTPVFQAESIVGNGNFRPVETPQSPDQGVRIKNGETVLVLGSDTHTIPGVNAIFNRIYVGSAGAEGYFSTDSLKIESQANPITSGISENKDENTSASNIEDAAFSILPDQIKSQVQSGEIHFDQNKNGYVRINPVSGKVEVWRSGITPGDKDVEKGWVVEFAKAEFSDGGAISVEAPSDYFSGRNIQDVKSFSDSFVSTFTSWQEQNLNNAFAGRKINVELVPEIPNIKNLSSTFVQTAYQGTKGPMIAVGNTLNPDGSVSIRVYVDPYRSLRQQAGFSKLEEWTISTGIMVGMVDAYTDLSGIDQNPLNISQGDYWSSRIQQIVPTPAYGSPWDSYGSIFS